MGLRNDEKVNRLTKWLLGAGVLAVVVVWSWVWFEPVGRLRMVFCDVGQGDAILVSWKEEQMLVDGGPGSKVLECLDRYLPLGDKELELVVVTHPDKDHMGGTIEVLRNYKVDRLATVPIGKETDVYKLLYKEIVQEVDRGRLEVVNLYAGDKVKLGAAEVDVVWPERRWVAERIGSGKLNGLVENTNDKFGDTGVRKLAENTDKFVLGASTDAESNDFSIVLHVKYGSFDGLLNGDAGEEIQDEELGTGSVPAKVEVMNAPHHGSRTGMLDEWLSLVDPQLAVISVGAKNSYGHPAEEILQRLKSAQVRYLRTDEVGDVVVESDGEKWWVESAHN